MDAVLHSSAKHDWQTPDVVLELVRTVGPIALDPCTTDENPCNAGTCIVPPADGMNIPWMPEGGTGIVYVNPPYGREIERWCNKCVLEDLYGCQIVLLVPARPDTAWYDAAMQSANALCEWRGRLRFKGAPSCAPFPSALFYWDPSPWLFCHVFAPHGRVRVLRERRP